ncbi:MAG: aminotransferase class V-fold PLP-dependent enzyme [Vicinamibacterales bacterium]
MSAVRPIYLDHHATTPVDPRVVEAMLPYFSDHFGNAASRQHAFGWKADHAVDAARQQVARLVGARAKEIVFTSGATEANTLALCGAVAARRDRGTHVVTVATEHANILDTCARLARQGCRVTVLPVESDGRVDVGRFTQALQDDTVVASVMAANNEIGVRQPLPALAAACRARGVWLHTDAAQAAGHVPFDVEALGVDLASFSAHKMYGPKGVGALYVRRAPRVTIEPQAVGGGQEQGLRAGTLNVPGVVGFGAAAALAHDGLAAEMARVAALRDRLLQGLQAGLDGVAVSGSMTERLPHNLHVRFAGVDGEALMAGLADEVAVSAGSACASGSREPSHVMTALGVDVVDRWSAVRFGLGRGTTAAEIDRAVACVVDRVQRLRAASPIAVGGRA